MQSFKWRYCTRLLSHDERKNVIEHSVIWNFQGACTAEMPGDLAFLWKIFIYKKCLYERTTKVLARQRWCTGLSEPSPFAYAIRYIFTRCSPSTKIFQNIHTPYIHTTQCTSLCMCRCTCNLRVFRCRAEWLSWGLGGSVGCAVRLETRKSRVQPPPRSATFFRGDWSWNIFYGHSLPSADSRRAVVSFWRKNVHNTGWPLRGLSLPSKRVVK